jgi:hypothetical protein
MKRAVLLMATMAAALLLGSGVALLSSTSAVLAATSLYPDLKTLTPTDLRFDTATIDGSTHNVLCLSNTVWNAGEGRMELRATTVKTTAGKKTRVRQRIYDDRRREDRAGDSRVRGKRPPWRQDRGVHLSQCPRCSGASGAGTRSWALVPSVSAAGTVAEAHAFSIRRPTRPAGSIFIAERLFR